MSTDEPGATRWFPTRRRALVAGGAVVAAAVPVLWPSGPGPRASDGPKPADFPSDVAVDWAGHYMKLVRYNGIPAPAAAEMVAELGLVLYAVLRAGDRDVRPLHEQGTPTLRSLRVPDVPTGQDWPLVANAAFRYLLRRRYVDLAGPVLRDADRAAERFADKATPQTRDRANEAGERIGAAVFDWYLSTMVQPVGGRDSVPCVRPSGPGAWETTPPDNAQSALPLWGLKPTLMIAQPSEDGPGPPPPPEYSDRPGSECHRLAEEVHRTVAGLTSQQRAIARHWSDDKWTISPPGHWLGIAIQLLHERGAHLATAAETLWRLGLSQHDAFVSCWWTKYRYNVVRPITYIRRVFGEANWWSPVPTPCFPEYTSGHSTQSAAAAEALVPTLGSGPFTDRVLTHVPPRSFEDFRAAAGEAAVSRLYGGIHYSNANQHGLAEGRRIGTQVAAVRLRG
nr:vanadium-dependent haloperoxidase [Kibdelosporangium sp. MJ126-NF4]CEL18697.1 hypothetical protein [Kibdelosporangium sp. MJ126-NF4]CTQ98181.1 hypothetical protein [Kibdelosporangium sp. MJ126-NF4]